MKIIKETIEDDRKYDINISQEEFEQRNRDMQECIELVKDKLAAFTVEDRSTYGSWERPTIGNDSPVISNLEFRVQVANILGRFTASFNSFSKDFPYSKCEMRMGGFTSDGHDWSTADAEELLSLTKICDTLKSEIDTKLSKYRRRAR